MNGVDESKVIYSCHLLLPWSDVRPILRLIQASPVPNRDEPVSIHPLCVNKLPSVDRGRLVQRRRIAELANYPIPTFFLTGLIVALNDVHICEGQGCVLETLKLASCIRMMPRH